MSEVHYPHAAHPGDNPEVHHETSDVNIRAILTFAAALAAIVVIVGVLMWVLFRYLSNREATRVAPVYPLAVTQEQRLPPEPRLQTNPRGDLEELRDSEEQSLKSYGWVDKTAGVVRIPIEEAMKIVVQKGLPARQESR